MVGMVKRVELHHRAIYFMAIGQTVAEIWQFFFDCSKMVAILHRRPPSWICDARVWTAHEGHLVVFITLSKFGWNRYSSFDNKQVFTFYNLSLKMPIHAPKIGFLGDMTP